MAKSPFSLEGKTAVVTGGGTGIGRSIAIEFARAGADVALCSRKLEHLEPVAKEITNLGRRTFAVGVDVRQEEQVKGIVERAVSEWGRLDIMVNNAGASFRAKPEEISINGWNTVIGINLNGVFPDGKKTYDAVAARVGMGRWGKVHEIAYPCIFLASDASSWMTGETIVIDGGPSPRESDEAQT